METFGGQPCVNWWKKINKEWMEHGGEQLRKKVEPDQGKFSTTVYVNNLATQ